MGRLIETAWRFFEKDNWPIEPLEKGLVLRSRFEGENGVFTCYAQEYERQEQLAFYSVMPLDVPDDKRIGVAEFITRANFGLVIGNFEFDFADGEVRFKTSVDAEGIEFTQALVKSLVYANVLTADRYLPGIMRVVYGEVGPEEAIREIEE